MSARVRILVDGGTGNPVAVKTATTPEEVAQLAYEAARLRRAAHPGVVALLDHRVISDSHAELHTRHTGRSLEHWFGDLARLAGLGAAVAATLADLHELGIVHGRIDPSHVLVGLDGRPRLCGFAALDPGVPATDVAGLGRTLDELAQRIATERRGTIQWRRGPLAERRAFEQLVAQATDPAVERRPSARGLAAALLAAVPDAELPPAGPWGPAPAARLAQQGLLPDMEPTGDDPADLDQASNPDDDLHFDDGLDSALDDHGDDAWVMQVLGDQSDTGEEDLFDDRPWTMPPRPVGPGARPSHPRHARRRTVERPRRYGTVVVVAGTAVVVIALAALLVRDPDPPGEPPDSAAGTTEDDEDVTSTGDPAADPASTGGDGCTGDPPSGNLVAADVDGDGCPEAVAVADGLVEAGRERWAVGEPSDLVAVGDWDCDGDATPAVYRPSTGDVFVFDAWATEGGPLAVEPTAQVPNGTTLDVSDSDDCSTPVVITSDGGRHPVAVEG